METIRYLTNSKGRRTAVVIPLRGNEAAVQDLLEDLYGHEKIQERKREKKIDSKSFVKGLKDEGLL